MKTLKPVLSLVVIALSAFRAQAQSTVILNGAPSRVIGSTRTTILNSNPNLVEGRELFQPNGVALDTSVSPPILYVADTANNRVLAWRDATNGQNGVRADKVIGQRDFLSTNSLGPGVSTGLSSPTGLAVDSQGNLWVADSGSNRILRFRRPFEQTSDLVFPDIVVGQTNLSSRAANGGSLTPTDTGLSSVAGTRIFRVGLHIDGSGNLWVTDPNNHRVLRFPAGRLTASNPAADLVLGQADFVSRNTVGITNANRVLKNNMNTPSAVTTDSAGRVFVSDAFARVLVYAPPLAVGTTATRLVGISTSTQPITNSSLGVTFQSQFGSIEGLGMINNGLVAVDTAAHRIVRYAPFETWPPESSTAFSPVQTAVIGQPDFGSGRPDQQQPEPLGNAFNAPIAVATNATGTEMYVADGNNNRVVRLTGGDLRTPSQVFGQISFNHRSPNLVEGREVYLFDGFATVAGSSARFAAGAGVAFDGNRFYVADTLNHRVLGFRDIRSVKTGDRADIVIGQPDFFRTVVNFPSNDANVASDSSLFVPASVAVDPDGNLWVADSGNSRVLRFPKPFDQPPGTTFRANLVLGQPGFGIKITDATSSTMARPFGIAFVADGSVLVSDSVHSRVLLFRKPAGSDFRNGQAAAVVFGQPDFVTTAAGSDSRRMFSPRGIATDTDDRLYVADTGNGRILIFNRAPVAGAEPAPALTLLGAGATAFNSPHGVSVSARTGEIWVADTIGNRNVRFPRFDRLVLDQAAEIAIGASSPLGVAQDQFGNLYVADASNRIAIHYPAILVRNAANFAPTSVRPLAPNTYASLGSFGGPLAPETVVFSEVPMPVTLADTQVLLNDKAVPLHFVSPAQINFLVPNSTPTSGNADLLVVRPSTGQILASGSVALGDVSPALFTAASNGTGQISALNQDNTVNSNSNPAQRGTVIQLFGTGIGFVAGAPAVDGAPATGLTPGEVPDVVIGTDFVPSANILYSGMAPNLIGVWQVNVRIPENIAPSASVPLRVRLRSQTNTVAPQNTTIAVRQ